ncbi:sigma-70 family RNA polymerase sigma factor [Roseovarius spongiae]|uniref:Sigma-70 family RNA polymerase sigma factor n=1 Tax=Roseovarius spongiae TaxID=2320272 RepID=A0A3A8BBX1_9RHOB|nr:sigma-70 family RNA polymerase sigma factor [Roseovarius spongiae]RKF16992.1 sigma-70 family RNA polymerase sigma factor [Roseovarius spongiae]
MPCPTDLPETFIALRPDLIRLARRIADNETEAQDLVQEVLLRLWRRQDEVRRIADPRAYARAALRNLYRQSLRRAPMLGLDAAEEPAIEPDVFAVLALSDLERAITQLPNDQAQLIRLVATGESSPRRLALRTGLPAGTVMSRLARARAGLREELGLAPGAPVSALM